MFKAVVRMLDGIEKQIQVSPVKRDNLKFAPPLTLNQEWGKVKYMGKGQGEPAVYVQVK